MGAAIGRGLLAAAALSLAACATEGVADGSNSLRDPLEPINRATFAFNAGMDDAFIRPAALVYRNVLPWPIREGIGNFTANVSAPATFANDLLQGEFTRARITLSRFLVNSTIGVAGLVDVAKDAGFPRHKEDFGQTLAVWGFGPGPYIVVPFLGPHTARHLGGRVADAALNPFSYLLVAYDLEWVGIVTLALQVVDRRERLIEAVDGLKKISIDYYTAARSGYWQSRMVKIHNGRIPSGVPGPEHSGDEDFDGDLDEDLDDDFDGDFDRGLHDREGGPAPDGAQSGRRGVEGGKHGRSGS